MDIETANRLYEFRKKSGLSQEELADKLGLSRQAVSKWERAEASPDTDNLIALAKIYGCTLDELLSSYKEVDEVINDKEEETADPRNVNDIKDGIHIKDGDDTVTIDNNGIKVESKGETKVVMDHKGIHVKKEHKKGDRVVSIVENVSMLSALTAYLLLGFLYKGTFAHGLNSWACFWPLFLTAFVPGSLLKAIIRKRINKFNMVMTATATYCFLGMMLGLWHPTWLIFLAIPAFYTLAKVIQPNDEDDDDEDDDDEDDDDEEDKVVSEQ